MKRVIRLLALVALVAASATGLSCDVNEYCLNCAVPGDGGDDGGDGDARDADPIDGPDADPCVPSGLEVCDGKDNDCNGLIDDAVPTVGDPCTEQRGECQGGIVQCTNGALSCTKPPMAEICDGKDNNCNGVIDDGDPGGGAKCGTDVGECVAGTLTCQNGAVVCIGAIGTVGGVPEACNAKDDDCDGQFDEGMTNLGSCGVSSVGLCQLGTRMCLGGGVVCVGSVGPSFELCDNLDQDCDGSPTNGYDLAGDPTNCGACGMVCNLPHAVEGCAGGMCTVLGCDATYHDNNNVASDGCEFGPCTVQGNEVCNGQDDDCDGIIDEGVVLPPVNTFCRTVGECAVGTTVSCDGANGLRCNYLDPDVSDDGMGNILAETRCDGLDNDCDGAIDEGQPNLGDGCDNGSNGICRTTGVFVCDPTNLDGPAVCNAPAGGLPGTEVCDGLDNDCNGTIDDGAATGNLTGQDWVTIGGTSPAVQIMKYEASRPDATATLDGSQSTHVCARPGVKPWTNITYPQAVAACSAVGARLCTETEWERMCSPLPTYPVAGPTGTTDLVYLEAEDALARTTASGDSWTDAPTQDFSGLTAVRALPDNGTNIAAGSALSNSPRLDFPMTLSAAGTYFVWVRMMGVATAGDSVHVGLTAGGAGTPNGGTLVTPTLNRWVWVRGTGITVAAAGGHMLSVFMAEDGTRVDAIAVTRSTSAVPPPFDERTWAYGTSPKTAQDQTCNGDPFDTNPAVAGDQDGILPTGSLAMCFANGAGTADAFDMSGNVKEWAIARAPGQNPLRGGASNNETNGLTCGLDFTLADDAFFFPNVGFRCCRN